MTEEEKNVEGEDEEESNNEEEVEEVTDTEEEEEEEETGESAQIERLRKERDKLKEKNAEVEDNLMSRINEIDSKINEKQINDLLDNHAGGDEDKRKALKQEFKNYRPDAKSSEDIASRMEKASRIVGSEPDSPSVTDGSVTSSGGGQNTASKTKKDEEYSDSVKEQGKVLGLTEEDYENKDNNN